MAPEKPAFQPARILIVDDHPAIRDALTFRLGLTADLRVCGEAAGTIEALRQVAALQPDLVVVDITLSEGDGLDLIKRLRERDPQLLILVWSMHSEDTYAERALRAGAQGYITKECAIGEIVTAIRQILSGEAYVSAQYAQRLVQQSLQRGPLASDQTPIDRLSDRELQVFRELGTGTPIAQLATQLHLSSKTVQTYALRIRQKLDLPDLRSLVNYAIRWNVSGEKSGTADKPPDNE